MKKWELNHDGNTIRVENSMICGEKLFVNGELQDEQVGVFALRSRLWGRLATGETIKVSLGGNLRVHCRIFINDKLVLSK